ncbi:MAG: hypothetical protein NC131_06350 [Roseburia sp.]|nr:hypothetical protein [Roseburia sp.]
MAKLVQKIRKHGKYHSIEAKRSKYPHKVYDSDDKISYLVDTVDICFINYSHNGVEISNLTIKDLIALKKVIHKSLKVLRGHEDFE